MPCLCATHSSSSSIGTATLVGYGLLNYRWVFSAERFLQSAIASGTSNPQLGGPVIRTFQLLPPGVPHIWNDVSEPQQWKVELWARNCRKWQLPRHFWVLLHCHKFTTWDRRLYFPSEGKRAEDFIAQKIRQLRPGLNLQTWVPKASTLTSRPPKPLCHTLCWKNNFHIIYIPMRDCCDLGTPLFCLTNVTDLSISCVDTSLEESAIFLRLSRWLK